MNNRFSGNHDFAVEKLKFGYSIHFKALALSTNTTATIHWNNMTVNCGIRFRSSIGNDVLMALLDNTIDTLQKVYMQQLRIPAQKLLLAFASLLIWFSVAGDDVSSFLIVSWLLAAMRLSQSWASFFRIWAFIFISFQQSSCRGSYTQQKSRSQLECCTFPRGNGLYLRSLEPPTLKKSLGPPTGQSNDFFDDPRSCLLVTGADCLPKDKISTPLSMVSKDLYSGIDPLNALRWDNDK